MSDHPTASSVKVSIGKGVEFDKPNEMLLANLYNIIRSPGSEDSKTAFKELRELLINISTDSPQLRKYQRTNEQKY